MSGSQILADISPNPTLLVKYDANRGLGLINLRTCGRHVIGTVFMEGKIVQKHNLPLKY